MRKEDYVVHVEKTTGVVPPSPPGIKNNIWNQIMIDLPLEDSNGNKVRITVHNRKMEHIMKDITVYTKWKNGFWYPCKNLNIWQKAFEMAKTIIEIVY